MPDPPGVAPAGPPVASGPLSVALTTALRRAGLPTSPERTVGLTRSLDMVKPPGIAEVIDWVAALGVLGLRDLGAAAVEAGWGSLLKNRDDHELARARGAAWLAGA